MISAKFAAILTFSVGVSLSQNCAEQVVTLFDQYNGDGKSLTISQRYLYNLTSENFDDLTHSVCVTGVWIFYENTLFNSQGNGKVESVFGRDNYCVNLRTVAGKLSSARYVGDPMNYKADSLTIYEHTFFEGIEKYTDQELANLEYLSENHQSIIVTGNSNWTVFDQPMFQGNEICLQIPQPGKYTPSFVSDLQGSANSVKYGSIQSVRKGCGNGTVLTVTLNLL